MQNLGETSQKFTVDLNTFNMRVNNFITNALSVHKHFTQFLTWAVYNFTESLSLKQWFYPVSTSTSITTTTYLYINNKILGGA